MSAHTLDLGAAIAAAVAPIVKSAVASALAEHEPPEPPRALLDGQRLALEFGVSERQVRRLVALGMPHVMIVESRRYCLADCLAWLRAQKGTP